MKKAALCTVLMLTAISTHAQGRTRKSDASLIANLTAIDDGVSKAMDTEGSRINSSRWDAPIVLIDASQTDYEAQKRAAEGLHSAISVIKSSGVVSSIQLFYVYMNFRNVKDGVGSFERDAEESQHDPALATDLTKIDTELIGEEAKISDSLQQSMVQDANDLAVCR